MQYTNVTLVTDRRTNRQTDRQTPYDDIDHAMRSVAREIAEVIKIQQSSIENLKL